MPPDSSATKQRLLDAAFAEFSAYGLAGARIDRIADEARANKRLIYVYFGNKEQLFDTVSETRLAALTAAVPLDTSDIPGYAGRLFDHLVANPDLLRLATWKQLERPDATDTERHECEQKLGAVRRAQKAGVLDDAPAPADLLALLAGLISAWFVVSPALRELSAKDPWSRKRLADHRAALVESARRLVEPGA